MADSRAAERFALRVVLGGGAVMARVGEIAAAAVVTCARTRTASRDRTLRAALPCGRMLARTNLTCVADAGGADACAAWLPHRRPARRWAAAEPPSPPSPDQGCCGRRDRGVHHGVCGRRGRMSCSCPSRGSPSFPTADPRTSRLPGHFDLSRGGNHRQPSRSVSIHIAPLFRLADGHHGSLGASGVTPPCINRAPL